MKLGFFDTVVNRLYYACFHATRALIITKDLMPKTHSGVLSSLHRYFVQTGEFEYKRASFFGMLMTQRNENDYNDLTISDESEVKELIEPAMEYIAYMENLVAQYLESSE